MKICILILILKFSILTNSNVIPGVSSLNKVDHLESALNNSRDGIVREHQSINVKSTNSKVKKTLKLVKDEGHASFLKYLNKLYDLDHPYRSLVSQFARLANSRKEHWGTYIRRIFRDISLKGTPQDFSEQYYLISILEHMFYSYNEIPIGVIQAILSELGKIAHSGAEYPDHLMDLMRETQALYKSRMEHYILSSIDSNQSLIKFSSIQKDLQEYGIKFSSEWSPKDQLYLYLLWTSDMELYETVKGKLQNVLETQVALINLIKSSQMFSVYKPSSDQVFIHWSESKIETYKDIILKYIDSCETDEELEDFLSIQKRMQEYDLKPTEALKLSNPKHILMFWLKYMHIYLKTRKEPDIYCLMNTVESLVDKDYESMLVLMDQFLSQPHHSQPGNKLPFLGQFLRYALQSLKIKDDKKMIINALRKYTILQTWRKIKNLFDTLRGIWSSKAI
ncbi:hypothetical protein DFH28DRAFT_976009 [Melampsora americana]|nr:hypothetical protein DFH28DRAFT_976009 [Melampsora americana]